MAHGAWRAAHGARRMALTARSGTHQANTVMLAFLRSVLGGSAVAAEVVRGWKAPVKAVRLSGVESADLAYHRLLSAHRAIK